MLSSEQLSSTFASLSALPLQIQEVWAAAEAVDLTAEYSQVKNIIVCGMGGSNLGARLIASALADRLAVPIIINADYDLPAFVNSDSLVILSSYSGTTEETLAASQPALDSGAKILAITASREGNRLQAWAISNQLPVLAFATSHNPSNQPRLAIGYSCFALAGLLVKLGLLKLSSEELQNALTALTAWGENLTPEHEDNDAKKIANGLVNKQIILVGGDFLAGNLHSLRNQINENAKHFASYLVLPDLNHHAMEGLSKPDSNSQNLIFLFFDSALYSKRVIERAKLTKQVVAKNNIAFADIQLLGKTKLEQSLEVLQLGAWITLYLALENDVDPLSIPWVDWFKQQLA
ncbi:hypothetical protein COT94_02805 [Candidatus Falkowbacteria bacterium CG10_big_fil_rev_8_21_14_0_10_37_14]|uniref:SIS domain-containing protein n=1 Tax=Candidatus Falkowbacteria bacterium CG10_big_fil_rev_8_21_14_0_10_37_14 TaxID=1974561 RepID=A0A2M6WT73_9BACT|nr:MAG: hypothetical protein COT94_02805 [Candidatus Falkowbacteria bacterium CG10_big_fil_rev_8_21_14_0_10_37_14]